MRYFQELELAEFMPISEAADWIAFGLLPTAEWQLNRENLPTEARLDVSSILDYQGHHFGPNEYLGRRLIAKLFPEIDADLYLTSFEGCGGSSPEEICKNIESWRELVERIGEAKKGDGGAILRAAERTDELDAELEAAKKWRVVRAPVVRKLRTAQANLFLKLISGEILARAVHLPNDEAVIESWERDDWPNSFQPVPPEEWASDNIDWRESNLTTWSMRYLGVVVATADVLREFPQPDIVEESVSGKLYGQAFLLESDNGEYITPDTIRPRRGAPRRTETILDAAIYTHLDALKCSGEFPKKVEAQIAEISHFVLERLGQGIARSTAQRILSAWKTTVAQKDAHN